MRILFVVHQFMPEFAAGTETVTLNLAKSAQAAGHYVEVLTASVREASLWPTEGAGLRQAVIDGVPVSAIPMHEAVFRSELGFRRDEAIARAARRFLDARPAFDVAHVTHSMRLLDAVETLRGRGLPYVVTVTDFFLPCYRVTLIRQSGEACQGPEGGAQCLTSCPIDAFGESGVFGRLARTRLLLQGAASVNTCSGYVAAVMAQEYPELPVRVVPHGIDLRAFDYQDRAPARDQVVFGCLGTISKDKGLHVLAQAFLDADPQNARLELIGPCFDDAFKDRLERIVGGDPRIALRPAIAPAERGATLAGLDVLCLPSQWPETFSLVMHEGFAAGLPCLVSDFGAPAAVVREHGCGEVVTGGDTADWARAIARASGSPDLRRTWRERVPLPVRVEEEGFFYDQLYRQAIVQSAPA